MKQIAACPVCGVEELQSWEGFPYGSGKHLTVVVGSVRCINGHDWTVRDSFHASITVETIDGRQVAMVTTQDR